MAALSDFRGVGEGRIMFYVRRKPQHSQKTPLLHPTCLPPLPPPPPCTAPGSLFWRQQFPSPDTKPSPISHNVSQPSFPTLLDLPGRLERLVEDPSIDAVVAADVLTGLIVRRDVDPQTSVCPGYTPSRLNEAMIRRLLCDINLPEPVVLGESLSSGDASIWNDLVDLLELWKGIVDPLSKEEIRFSEGLCLIMAFLPTVGVLEASCVPKLALDLDRAVGWKSSTQELIRRHLLILICRFIREGGEERRLLRIRFVEPYLTHFCLAALRKRLQEKKASSSITSPVAAAPTAPPPPYYTPADHPIKVLTPGQETSGESYWRNATILESRSLFYRGYLHRDLPGTFGVPEFLYAAGAVGGRRVCGRVCAKGGGDGADGWWGW